MTRKAYPSDLNEVKWGIIELLLPSSKASGRPREVELREIINGIFDSAA
jgi:transposase